MTKKEMDLLEKVFGAEIENRLHQCTNKIAAKLKEDGLIEMCELTLGRDNFGAIKVKGYALTDLGRAIFCDQCTETRSLPGGNKNKKNKSHVKTIF